jgi:hypothetical protein
VPGVVKVQLTGESQQAVQSLEGAAAAVEKIGHKGGEAKSALVELKDEAHHLSAAFVSVERIAVHFFAVFEAGKKVIELGAEAWELYHAKMEAALSGTEARDHARDLASAISRQIAELRDTGRITGSEALQLSVELGLAREREGKGLHDLAAKLIALNPHKKETELLLAEVQTRKQALEIEYNDKEKLGILDLAKINDFTRKRLALADEETGLEQQLIGETAKNQQEADLKKAISAEKLKQEKNRIYAEQTAAAQKFVGDEAQARAEADEELAKALIDQAEGWEEVRKGQEEQAKAEREQAEARRREGRERQLMTLDQIKLDQRRIETDPEKSAVEKRRQLLPLYQREIELIQQEMAARSAEANDPKLSTEEQLKSARERVLLEERLLDIRRAQQALQDQDFAGSMRTGLTQLSDAWDNLGHNVAQSVLGAIQIAVQGVTDAIMGAIEGTRTWGQVFLQVGRQILATIINVVVQWVVSMTLLKLLKKIFAVEDNAAAAQSAAAWAPAAVAASIASYGAAAAAGTLAAVAGVASGTAVIAGLAAGLGAYATGGIVRGGEQLIRVNERGQEAILNAQALSNVGEGFVAALNAGLPIQQAAAVSPAAPSIKNNQQVTVAVFNDQAKMADWLRNQEGQAVIVDVVKANLHNITGRS